MGIKEKTHTVSIHGVTEDQIWKVWTDINNWHIWDTDIEWAKINGAFENGNKFYLKPKSGPKVKITITNVEANKAFTDLCSFPLAKMYSIHELTPIDGGISLSHTIRVEGLLSELWWQLVAKDIADGLQEQSEKLIERARQIRD